MACGGTLLVQLRAQDIFVIKILFMAQKLSSLCKMLSSKSNHRLARGYTRHQSKPTLVFTEDISQVSPLSEDMFWRQYFVVMRDSPLLTYLSIQIWLYEYILDNYNHILYVVLIIPVSIPASSYLGSRSGRPSCYCSYAISDKLFWLNLRVSLPVHMVSNSQEQGQRCRKRNKLSSKVIWVNFKS